MREITGLERAVMFEGCDIQNDYRSFNQSMGNEKIIIKMPILICDRERGSCQTRCTSEAKLPDFV